INDTLGHPKGDEVIEVFLQTVSSVVQGRADAYRNGGDEVVVIAPRTTVEAAKTMLVQILTGLANERVESVTEPITASSGIAMTSNPASAAEELLAKADRVMYRAKEESKKRSPRASTLAVEDGPVEVIAA